MLSSIAVSNKAQSSIVGWAFSGLHDRKQNVGRGHVGDQRLPGTDAYGFIYAI